MLMQTGQLKAVVPTTPVDGFSVSIARHNYSIVADSIDEDLVIDYYFEITVVCDGTNPTFPEAKYMTVALSQLIGSCDREFEADYPLIVLEQFEQLTSIAVIRGNINGLRGVWLVITVFSGKSNNEYQYVFCFYEE